MADIATPLTGPPLSMSDPAANFFVITPNDTITLTPAARGVNIGGAGTLVVDGIGSGVSITLTVTAGDHPYRVKKVYAASTATGIVGMY